MSQNDSPPSPPMRRASFAPGQKLTEMFGRSPTSTGGSSAFPGPIAAAAANAHAHQRRRMSISTLGLSGSPNQTSPFTPNPPRKESVSSSSSTSPDECAIDESGDGPSMGSFGGSHNTAASSPASGTQPAAGPPASPFTRRLSFGARAMREARNGEGFNWSDQMRSRAERSTSMSSSPTVSSPGPKSKPPPSQMPAEQPVREMPKQQRAPDHFQERILKGDFYMD